MFFHFLFNVQNTGATAEVYCTISGPTTLLDVEPRPPTADFSRLTTPCHIPAADSAMPHWQAGCLMLHIERLFDASTHPTQSRRRLFDIPASFTPTTSRRKFSIPLRLLDFTSQLPQPNARCRHSDSLTQQFKTSALNYSMLASCCRESRPLHRVAAAALRLSWRLARDSALSTE